MHSRARLRALQFPPESPAGHRMSSGKSGVAVEYKRILTGLPRKVADQGNTIRRLSKEVAELER